MLWRRQSTCCRFMLHFKTTSSYNWLLSATKMRSNKNQQNCRSTLSPLTGGKLLPGWFLAKSHIVFSGMRQLFFVTLSLNNLGFGIKWRLHYIYFRFSLQVYTVNFCKSEKTDFTAAYVNGYKTHTQRWQNVIAMNVIRRRLGLYHIVGKHARALSTWRIQTGSSFI